MLGRLRWTKTGGEASYCYRRRQERALASAAASQSSHATRIMTRKLTRPPRSSRGVDRHDVRGQKRSRLFPASRSSQPAKSRRSANWTERQCTALQAGDTSLVASQVKCDQLISSGAQEPQKRASSRGGNVNLATLHAGSVVVSSMTCQSEFVPSWI